jgi:hypothetical protein
MGTGGSFTEDKAVGAWSWLIISQLVPRWRIHGSIQPLHHTPSWRKALLSTGTTLPY